jgi:hypothetical protein
VRLKRALASLAHFARCLGRYSLNGDYAVGHDQVARALGTVHFEVIKQTRRERDAALVDRDRKIERLEAKLDAVLTMLGGGKAKSAAQLGGDDSVVELPRFISKVRRDVA